MWVVYLMNPIENQREDNFFNNHFHFLKINSNKSYKYKIKHIVAPLLLDCKQHPSYKQCS